MLLSTAPGTIGLDSDTRGYGRTVPPGTVTWFRLIGTGRRSPCDPKYPIIRPIVPISRSTLAFHDCIRAGRKFGSVNAGFKAVPPAPPIALSSLMLLVAVPDACADNGVTSGGLPVMPVK